MYITFHAGASDVTNNRIYSCLYFILTIQTKNGQDWTSEMCKSVNISRLVCAGMWRLPAVYQHLVFSIPSASGTINLAYIRDIT